ncbi:hypothetical protein [Pelagibius sp.]|uniref:hypothetical protein n=1 Tax=Pelagibius sp. TaxID=1931238 RepID=UPI003BB11B27
MTAALGAALLCLPSPAFGEASLHLAQGPQCAPREALLKALAKKYKEAPVNMGVTSTGSLIEILASPSGSWTILVTVPGRPTCMVSSGQGWRSLRRSTRKDPEA